MHARHRGRDGDHNVGAGLLLVAQNEARDLFMHEVFGLVAEINHLRQKISWDANK